MTFLTSLGILFVAANLTGAGLSQKVLRLIGPDTMLVSGTNMERHQNSAWGKLFAMPPEWDAARGVHQVITIEGRSQDGPRSLTVIVGTAPAPGEEPDDAPRFTVLDASTAIGGDPVSVEEAVRSWAKEERPGELAAKAGKLAETYDNWFLVVKPLAAKGMEVPRGPNAPALKYRSEVIDAIEEVSGGIRFGAFNEVGVEALMKRSEDAATVAGLARWIPGMAQWGEPSSVQSRLADAVENAAIRTEGRTVSVSFILPEQKLRESLEAARRIATER